MVDIVNHIDGNGNLFYLTGILKMKHTYRIAVSEHNPQRDNQLEEVMLFDAAVHDNLTELLPKVTTRLELSAEQSQAFLLGLKLLGEVIMTERANPLIRELAPHFRAMMQVIKPARS